MTKHESDYVDQVVELVLACEREPDLDIVPTERVTLPMIPLSFGKHRAIPQHLLKVLFGGCSSNGSENQERPVG